LPRAIADIDLAPAASRRSRTRYFLELFDRRVYVPASQYVKTSPAVGGPLAASGSPGETIRTTWGIRQSEKAAK